MQMLYQVYIGWLNKGSKTSKIGMSTKTVLMQAILLLKREISVRYVELLFPHTLQL